MLGDDLQSCFASDNKAFTFDVPEIHEENP